jgi:RNA polymerase sigma factor (sigma-70 family)
VGGLHVPSLPMNAATLRPPFVAIVDDDAAVRDSLALLLRLRGFAVRTFASGDEFLGFAGAQEVDCVLLDLRMSGSTGLEVQAELARRHLDYPIVVVTAHGDVATTRAALKAGAFDFIEKPFDDEVLLKAIGAAIATSAERRVRAERRLHFAQSLAKLTPREREVLDHVLAGRHNREIAVLLAISPRTVEVYKARLMDKLGVDRLPDLIRLALEMGLGK